MNGSGKSLLDSDFGCLNPMPMPAQDVKSLESGYVLILRRHHACPMITDFKYLNSNMHAD
jgi:hypothetical protein